MRVTTVALDEAVAALVVRRVELLGELAAVGVEGEWEHGGVYYPNAYDCHTARQRTVARLMRELERVDQTLSDLDGELAIREWAA